MCSPDLEHDAAPPHIDEGVGGAEVYGHVTATETGEIREKAHEEGARAARAAEPPRALSVSKGPGAEMARKRAFRPRGGSGSERGEERPETLQRQPHDVQVVALDPLDHRGARTPDRAGPANRR